MRHRMNRGPHEEGKAGQDNEQPPEDQDSHACNIPRSLPPFKVPAMCGRTLRFAADPVLLLGLRKIVRKWREEVALSQTREQARARSHAGAAAAFDEFRTERGFEPS